MNRRQKEEKASLVSIVACVALCACCHRKTRTPAATPGPETGQGAANAKELVGDPVVAIKSVLPQGWVVLKTQDDPSPFYRPAGKGKAIFLGYAGQRTADEKPPYEAVLYIMAADYQDGGEDPTNGKAQTYPPRLIGTTENAKVYWWPADVGGWPTAVEDVLRAILK